MHEHRKKRKSASLITVLFMTILVLFAVLFYIQDELKSQVRWQIDLLPFDHDKYCSPELKEEIDSFKNESLTYRQMKDLLADLKEFNEKHTLQLNYPAVYVFSEDGTGNDLKNYHGKKVMRVVIVDEEGRRTEDKNVTVNVRGNSTSAGDKRPYNLKFSGDRQILDLGKDKKWSLLAECFDPTLIRDALFFKLAEQMGLDYTPDARFARVYMDGLYKGCYLLSERTDIASDRVDIDPFRGEFIFEYEEEREEDETKYITTANGWRFAIKDPDEPSDKVFAHMEEVLNRFDAVITSRDYDQLKDVIDIDGFAKYYLLSELAKPIDFDYSSVKFYLKNGLIHAGPVWDYDISSGNYDIDFYSIAWYGETAEEKKQNRISYYDLYCDRNPVYAALLEYEEFRSLVKEYLSEYGNTIENLYADGGVIDQIVEENRDLFMSNYTPTEAGGAGWQVDHRYSGLEADRFPSYEENVEYLKTWIKNRYEWLRDSDPWK